MACSPKHRDPTSFIDGGCSWPAALQTQDDFILLDDPNACLDVSLDVSDGQSSIWHDGSHDSTIWDANANVPAAGAQPSILPQQQQGLRDEHNPAAATDGAAWITNTMSKAMLVMNHLFNLPLPMLHAILHPTLLTCCCAAGCSCRARFASFFCEHHHAIAVIANMDTRTVITTSYMDRVQKLYEECTGVGLNLTDTRTRTQTQTPKEGQMI
jgi:hypothetical protein